MDRMHEYKDIKNIKNETIIIEDQEFNDIFKEEVIKVLHNTDNQLFQKGSRVMPFAPNVICGDQKLNENIKPEIVDNRVFNGYIKEEINEESAQTDNKLFQKGSRVMPFATNVICGDQKLNENIKPEIVDNRVFNGYIKEEINEEPDQTDYQLFQKGIKTEENKIEIDFMASHEFKEKVLKESNSSEFMTQMKSNETCNSLSENPFSNTCDEMFTASNYPLARTHNREIPHNCKMCDFELKNPLKRHGTQHIGEKPYICDICSRAFARKFNLINHKRTHTGEKPYKCDLCYQAFARNQNLKRHRVVHISEMPYKCNICDRAFNHQTSLIRHKKRLTCIKAIEM